VTWAWLSGFGFCAAMWATASQAFVDSLMIFWAAACCLAIGIWRERHGTGGEA
jgi:4-amino-4-deoxy-L-arabinose transferase-like glycosyltransferase